MNAAMDGTMAQDTTQVGTVQEIGGIETMIEVGAASMTVIVTISSFRGISPTEGRDFLDASGVCGIPSLRFLRQTCHDPDCLSAR